VKFKIAGKAIEYAMPRVASGLGLKLHLAILPTFILVNTKRMTESSDKIFPSFFQPF
jgi:hypothetical protein